MTRISLAALVVFLVKLAEGQSIRGKQQQQWESTTEFLDRRAADFDDSSIRGRPYDYIKDEGRDLESAYDETEHGEMRDATATSQQEEASDRLIVKYSSEYGRYLTLELASKVYHDFPRDDSVVVELSASAQADLRKQSSDIVSVDGDDHWVEQGYFVKHVNLTRTTASGARLLQEDVSYAIPMVQADLVNVGQASVRICLVDTGAAVDHPDLPDELYRGASRYADTDNSLLEWWIDVRGHGTHTAGTINAIGDNGIGVRGIGRIPVYITRGLDNLGQARESDVLEAIEQCEQSDAKIISLSLGGNSLSDTFRSKIEYLHNTLGMMIFAASGNDGQRLAKMPGAHPYVVSVGAVDSQQLHWHASNTGPWVELVAPGVDIVSTSVNGQGEYVYSSYSGTSMSTPVAAGVASLLWSSFPNCKNSQIRYAMAVSAKDLNDGTSTGGLGCDEKHGFGIVQALSAMQYLATHPCGSDTLEWGGDNSHEGGCSVVW